MSTEKQLKRIQIDLEPEMVHMLSVLSEQHGMNTKNFVEYIVRIATGLLPPPPIAPLTATQSNKETPAIAAKEPETDLFSEPQANKRQDATEPPQPPKRDERLFTTKVARSIFTDGKEFRLNKFGKISYHTSLEEAIKLRDQ